MLEMKITITAPELSGAINNLAKAISHVQDKNSGTMSNAAPTSTTCVPANTAPTTPAQVSAPVNPAQPVPTAPAPAVPTSAPQYTLDMIATAGSALIDAGKMDQLMQLLGKFGVASLTELAPENYGAIAGELRALGAAI